MAEAVQYRPGQRTAPRRDHGSYPLERLAVVVGGAVGSVAGLLFFSPLAGFAVFILFVCAGLLWRDREPPTLVFCLSYQWFFVVTGIAFRGLAGYYPGLPFLGNLSGAVTLSLFGLLALAAGVRAAGLLLPEQLRRRQRWLRRGSQEYQVPRLFLLVVVVYTLNYLVNVSPALFFFNLAQIIERLLEFREVLLFLLLLTVLRSNRGYYWGAAGFLFALVPRFSSAQSVFKELFFIVLLCLLAYWRPWSASRAERGRSATVAVVVLALVVGLGGLGLFWEGAVKPIWRQAYRTGNIQGSPTERVAEFSGVVVRGMGDFDLEKSTEALVARLSSGVGYFSHVLEHVPAIVPHEGGALTLRAMRHIVTPRFLFPDKGNLGLDSWLVRIYAGLDVAGEELQTSVGLTYMGQFYIDFGTYGMFLPLLGYGLLLGLLHRSLVLVSPSFGFFVASSSIIFINHFTSYEGEIAKLLGGLIQSFVVFTAILALLGPTMHDYLSGQTAPGRRATGRRAPRAAGLRQRNRPHWAPPLRRPGTGERA